MSSPQESLVGSISASAYEATQRSPEFAELRGRYRRFAFPMTLAFLSWYATFVLLSVFVPDFMAQRVSGNLTVGLIVGLGQFVSTGLITWAYVRHANRKLDPIAEKLCDELEGRP